MKLRILMHGKSMTRQIIEPFISQLRANTEPLEIEVIAAGLFEPGKSQYSDGSSQFGIDSCIAIDFKKRKSLRRTIEKKTLAQKIGERIKSFHQPYRSLLNAWKMRESVDLFHCQGIFDARFTNYVLKAFPAIPLVVSCWGSDVLRTHDIRKLKHQKKLLYRANIVTVSSPEFREIILAKFGQKLRSKIRITQFSPTLDGVLSKSEHYEAPNFREKYSISEKKYLIGLAHNGHKDNQHLELIESLGQLSSGKKESIHLIVPMTYGGKPLYQREVEDSLKKHHFDFTILDSFLTEEDVVELRCAIQVFIYAPITDAFSATVSQALAAGSECILGSWLPYSARVKAGFLYTEIDEPGGVCEALENVLTNFQSEKSRREKNRECSLAFFSKERLGNEWASVYREAALAR